MLLLTMQGITSMHDTSCSAQKFLFTLSYHSFRGFVNEGICMFYRMYFLSQNGIKYTDV